MTVAITRSDITPLLSIVEPPGRHQARCCELAADWLRSLDTTIGGARPARLMPSWVTSRWRWGWSPAVPLCQAVQLRTLSCSPLANIGLEVIRRRTPLAARLQIVMDYSEREIEECFELWRQHSEDAATWTRGRSAYHVVVTYLSPEDELFVWDPSTGSRLDIRQDWREGRLRALRVLPDSEEHTAALQARLDEELLDDEAPNGKYGPWVLNNHDSQVD